MSNAPVGFYKKRDRYGREVVHPITAPDSSDSQPEMDFGEGGNMQVQEVRHEPQKIQLMDKDSQLSHMANDMQKIAKGTNEWFKDYQEKHSPEAQLLKQSQEIQRLEYEEYLREKRDELKERIAEKKQEKVEKAIEQIEKERDRRARGF